MTNLSLSDADRGAFAAVASAEAPPGTIVHDFDALLDYLGSGRHSCFAKDQRVRHRPSARTQQLADAPRPDRPQPRQAGVVSPCGWLAPAVALQSAGEGRSFQYHATHGPQCGNGRQVATAQSDRTLFQPARTLVEFCRLRAKAFRSRQQPGRVPAGAIEAPPARQPCKDRQTTSGKWPFSGCSA
jgi:hypothetical protein